MKPVYQKIVRIGLWVALTGTACCQVEERELPKQTSEEKYPGGVVAVHDDSIRDFYRDGVLLRRYSTLDIAGRPENVRASVSHYEVIGEIAGYAWLDGNRYAFAVRTVDGRVLRFDAGTGEAIAPG